MAEKSFPFHDAHVALYSVGQVAEMLDVQPAFLRRLDSEAFVQPSRSQGGQRRYSQNEIYLIERIRNLALEGMTLNGIRKILELESQVKELKAEVTKLKSSNRQDSSI